MKETSKNFNIALIVSAVLAVVAVAIYLAEHAGVIGSNLSNIAPWGIYLAGFMLFAGVGAGCLIAAAAPKALGLASLDAGLERTMAWTGFAALLCAGVAITIDLGSPLRMVELLTSPNPSSPLFLDIIALPVAIVLALVYALKGGDIGGKAFRWVVLAWGVFVLCVDAWILAFSGSHGMWSSSILLPWFVATGCLCGAAVLAVAAALTGREVPGLKRAFVALVVVDLLFYALDLAGGGEAGLVLTGALAPLFWCQMVLYAAALALALRGGNGLMWAGVAALAGVAVKRLTLMAGGFQTNALSLPNAFNPYPDPSALVYVPAATELLCAVGLVGLCVLVALLGVKYLELDAS